MALSNPILPPSCVSPRQINPVRELSIMNLRKPLVAMRFLPWSGSAHDASSNHPGNPDPTLPGFTTPPKGESAAAFRMAGDPNTSPGPRPRGFLESKAGLLHIGEGNLGAQAQIEGPRGAEGNHVAVGDGAGPEEERDVAATTQEHSLRAPTGGSGSTTPNGLRMEDLSLGGTGGTPGKRPSGAGGVHVSGSTPVRLDSATGRTGAGAGTGGSGAGGGAPGGGFGTVRSNSLTDLQRYATSAANERSYREALAEAVLRQPTR